MINDYHIKMNQPVLLFILILKEKTMVFILTAFDSTDPDALERRMKTRPDHLEKIAHVKKAGNYLFGGAILNDSGEMIGSVIIYDVPDRATLDRILENEPYIYDHVWENIEIRPFRPAKIE
jgi:uncharacterized protein YciI